MCIRDRPLVLELDDFYNIPNILIIQHNKVMMSVNNNHKQELRKLMEEKSKRQSHMGTQN